MILERKAAATMDARPKLKRGQLCVAAQSTEQVLHRIFLIVITAMTKITKPTECHPRAITKAKFSSLLSAVTRLFSLRSASQLLPIVRLSRLHVQVAWVVCCFSRKQWGEGREKERHGAGPYLPCLPVWAREAFLLGTELVCHRWYRGDAEGPGGHSSGHVVLILQCSGPALLLLGRRFSQGSSSLAGYPFSVILDFFDNATLLS